MITVIDYGMGNLRSVTKAFELYTAKVRVSSNPDSVYDYTGVVLTGDGAFAQAMENLEKNNWIGVLKNYIKKDGFFLGICLGFQLLFTGSDEFGYTPGLDIIPGKVVKFDSKELKVPHMGWNQVKIRNESVFLGGIDDLAYFYFIHSFYPEIKETDWVIGTAEYGITFPCIVGKKNLVASQFHPEKSHRSGLKIIENFSKLSNSI
jgi:imidazole glycerol-phosphate synthase subunit HisH